MIKNGELEEVQGGRSIIRRKWTNDPSFFISDLLPSFYRNCSQFLLISN
jgi:hypothetical protein